MSVYRISNNDSTTCRTVLRTMKRLPASELAAIRSVHISPSCVYFDDGGNHCFEELIRYLTRSLTLDSITVPMVQSRDFYIDGFHYELAKELARGRLAEVRIHYNYGNSEAEDKYCEDVAELIPTANVLRMYEEISGDGTVNDVEMKSYEVGQSKFEQAWLDEWQRGYRKMYPVRIVKEKPKGREVGPVVVARRDVEGARHAIEAYDPDEKGREEAMRLLGIPGRESAVAKARKALREFEQRVAGRGGMGDEKQSDDGGGKGAEDDNDSEEEDEDEYDSEEDSDA